MPPRPDNAARTHRPRGPSGAARGCEASSYPENRRVFRIILVHYLLSVDGKRERVYHVGVGLEAGSYKPSSCFFFISNSSDVRSPSSRSLANLVISSAIDMVTWVGGLYLF